MFQVFLLTLVHPAFACCRSTWTLSSIGFKPTKSLSFKFLNHRSNLILHMMSLSSNNPGENFRISYDTFLSCPHSKMSSYFMILVYCTWPIIFQFVLNICFQYVALSCYPIILPAHPPLKKTHMRLYFLSLLLILSMDIKVCVLSHLSFGSFHSPCFC